MLETIPSLLSYPTMLGLSGLLLAGCIGGTRSGSETAIASSTASDTAAPAPDPAESMDLQIFLLIGQSNMEGTPKPESVDQAVEPRVRVLGYDDCNGRTYNRWAPASPPLHRCWVGVGPADSFGKAMAEAWPEATIGLVPAALSGVDIDIFRKGVVSKRRKEFKIPPDDARSGAYEMVIERARLAQQNGHIRGILFHQGESDTGNSEWVGKVRELVSDLRKDLGLGDDVPFVAGELLYSGCCASHNRLVQELPSSIPNAYVVSAEGLAGMDNYHFDLAGQRQLGRRYADAILQALGADKGPPRLP